MEPINLDSVLEAAFEEAVRSKCAHGVVMVEWCDDCVIDALEAAVYVDGGECDL